MHLMIASKKGVSAHQMHRMLGVSYKIAWFMAHRIREAMTDRNAGPIGGAGKFLDADETFIGDAKKAPKKQHIMALVERGGQARSFHIANVRERSVLRLSKPRPASRISAPMKASGISA
jgi:hypothetical protein